MLFRSFVNRIQNLRKESGLDVTDTILLKIKEHNYINAAINNNKNYICSETLASSIELVNEVDSGLEVEVEDGVNTIISIAKTN